MEKIVFTSDDLPDHLDDQARFVLWRDLFVERYGSLDVSRPDDRKFSMSFEYSQFGAVGLGQFEGTLNRVARTPHDIANGGDEFLLDVNRGSSPLMLSHRDRETLFEQGSAVLISNADPGAMRAKTGAKTEHAWAGLVVGRRQLIDLVANAEDLLAVPLDSKSAAVRYLHRYVGIIGGADGLASEPALREHVGTTLLDLIALALGTGREATELAQGRGLRVARLQDVLLHMQAGFADPAFSAHVIARKLGLSVRYIQDLLQPTGVSFAERVMELRLQKARAMLADSANDRMNISDIALSSGFNEVSYFHRSFRRRFGATPVQYRGGGAG